MVERVYEMVACPCPLCKSDSRVFSVLERKEYRKCSVCQSVFMNPKDYLPQHLEKARYKEHENDVNDPRYQRFVSPIVEEITRRFDPTKHRGLDFGSGTGPVITKMLREFGYGLTLYDPYFFDNKNYQARLYDFIVCCEVMEHFHQPQKEFFRLRGLLKNTGAIYCMTRLYDPAVDFTHWHYRRDPTHVFFYHRRALAWIRSRMDFSSVRTDGKLICLRVW